MSLRRDVEELARVVDLIARRCRNGIPALLGRRPRPSDSDLYEMFEWHETDSGTGVKVSSGVNLDKIPNLAIRKTAVDVALDHVGWDVLVSSAKQFSTNLGTERDWRAYKMHCLAEIVRGGYNGGGSNYEKIAVETEMSSSRVRRCIKRVPSQIAALALSGLTLNEEAQEAEKES